MALKTSASLFIFSCDIIGSKEKLRTCRPFLKEKNRPLTLKGDQGIIGKELKCEDFPATHGHLKVRLHHLIWKKMKGKKMKLSFCFVEGFLCRCACNLSFLSFVIKYTKYQQLVPTKGAFVARIIVKRLKKLS